MRVSSPTALVAFTALSLAVFSPRVAGAQGASSQAAAQALFEQARQLMADGKFAEACPKFVESQKLDPGAGTLLNLGACYEKNGQTASAWVTFKDAAAAADVKHRADWSARARDRARVLEATLSRLIIDVPAEVKAVAGVEVTRDGVEVGSAVWGVPIPVDPGDHVVEAVAPGKKHWQTTAHVGQKSDQAHVAVPVLEDDVVPTAVAAAPAPAQAPSEPPPPSPSDGSGQRTAGLVVGGVGVAGVVVGSIFGVMAMGKESSSKTACPTSECSNPQAVSDNSDAKSSATVSTIGLIAGAALVAGGAAIYFTAPKKHPTSAAFHLAPAMGPGQIGFNLGGAW
jgi:hypothetical protein